MIREGTTRESEAPGISPTVMAHIFRGEISRSDTWRTRLDTTMNWAITTTGAVLSFAFGTTSSSHVVILVGFWLVTMFLLLEARRYRYYDLWNRRVRLIEAGYWAPMVRKEPVDPDSMRELASDMSRPQLQLSLFSAISTRMQRAYGALILVLLASWFAKVIGHPKPARSWEEFFRRAHIGPLPGELVVGVLTVVTLFFVLLFISALIARPPMGELRSRPRSHRLPMWQVMFRPYAVPPPAREGARKSHRPQAH